MTENIKYTRVALTIDGVQAHRVQNLGSSGDIPTEKLKELTNRGSTEIRTSLPAINVTIDTNDIGSTDTLALVSDKMIDKTLATETNGPRGGFFRNYIKNASSNATERTITADDLLDCYCDFMIPITEDGTNITRAAWIHRASISGLSWSYDVNGYASENYSFTADNKRWFLNDWKVARVYKPHNVAQKHSGDATTQTWNNMASAVPDGSKILYYCKNEHIYRNSKAGYGSGTVEISTAGTYNGVVHAGQIWVSTSGVTLNTAASTDDVYFVYVCTAAAASAWAEGTKGTKGVGYDIVSTSGSFGGITREYLAAYLYNTGGPIGDTALPSEPTLRLQSVNIDYSATDEELVQLSYKRRYGYSRIDPVFTITVSANDSDLDMFARACATSDASAKTISMDDFTRTNKLVVKTYKDENRTQLVRTMTISDLAVSSENWNVSVGGNASQEFTFTADNISVVGNDVSLTGY